LREDKQTPDEHPLKQAGGSAAEKFSGKERGGSEREGEEFRDGENPEGGGKARKLRQESSAEFVREPGRDASNQFTQAGKSPDGEKKEINGE